MAPLVLAPATCAVAVGATELLTEPEAGEAAVSKPASPDAVALSAPTGIPVRNVRLPGFLAPSQSSLSSEYSVRIASERTQSTSRYSSRLSAINAIYSSQSAAKALSSAAAANPSSADATSMAGTTTSPSHHLTLYR